MFFFFGFALIRIVEFFLFLFSNNENFIIMSNKKSWKIDSKKVVADAINKMAQENFEPSWLQEEEDKRAWEIAIRQAGAFSSDAEYFG